VGTNESVPPFENRRTAESKEAAGARAGREETGHKGTESRETKFFCLRNYAGLFSSVPEHEN
jgi:hypothetical protein